MKYLIVGVTSYPDDKAALFSAYLSKHKQHSVTTTRWESGLDAMQLLSEWADRILIIDPHMTIDIPFRFKDKVSLLDFTNVMLTEMESFVQAIISSKELESFEGEYWWNDSTPVHYA